MATATLPTSLAQAIRLTSVREIRCRYFSKPQVWVDLEDLLISIEWQEDKDMAAREFTVILDNWNGETSRVVRGGVLLIQYRNGDAFQEWFRGTVVSDSAELDASTAQKTLRVLDPMRVLGATKGRFSFREGKTASESIRTLLTKYRFPISDHFANTHVKLPAVSYQGSLYDAIRTLLVKTEKLNGGRFVSEVVAGRFVLVQYGNPAWVWDIDDVISHIRREVNIETMIDGLKLTGKESVTVKGKSGRKVTRLTSAVARSNRAKLLSAGFIQVTKDADEANTSNPKILSAANQDQATNSRPVETVEIDMPYDVMTLRRLQPVHFDQSVAGASGRYTVSSVQGRVGGDGGSISLVLTKRPEFYFPQPTTAASSAGGSGKMIDGAIPGSPIAGQKPMPPTHQTAGLPGYPAFDYMAPAGTPVVAPVDGKIPKLSGHDPSLGGSPGGPLGYSIYIDGTNGKSYFLTHLDKVLVKVGQTVKQGEQIAEVANGPASWSSPHVHMGVHG